MKRVMLVDDEKNVLQALQRSMRKVTQEEQLALELYTSVNDAVKRLGEATFHMIISDYHMPEMLGIEFLKIAKVLQPDAIRLMLSASAEFKTVLGAVNEAEVFRYIEKPWNDGALEEIVRLGLIKYDQSQSEQALLDQARLQRNEITPQELEEKRLEKEEPGITKVIRGSDGSIFLE
jgi:two-component system, probable response regulator PhcQ